MFYTDIIDRILKHKIFKDDKGRYLLYRWNMINSKVEQIDEEDTITLSRLGYSMDEIKEVLDAR